MQQEMPPFSGGINPLCVSEFSLSGQFMGYLPDSAGATAFAVSGNDMYVSFGSHIAEYTTSGQLLNPSVVSGLSYVAGIAVFTFNWLIVKGSRLRIESESFARICGN